MRLIQCLRKIKEFRARFCLVAVILWLLLISSSCTTMLYFDKTEPPEIKADITPCKIAFVNQFDYTLHENATRKYRKVYKAAVDNFIGEFFLKSAGDSTKWFFIADTLRKGVSPDNQTAILPTDTVSMMCSDYRSDYLITLDSVSVFFQADEESGFNDDGEFMKTYGDVYMVADFFLTFYDSSGNMVDRSEVAMSRKYASNIRSFSEDLPSVSGAAEETSDLAKAAADDYLNKFYPGSSTDSRMVYKGSRFREANDLILERKWDEASELLQGIINGSNRFISKKARHNLEVMEEIRNSIVPETEEP